MTTLITRIQKFLAEIDSPEVIPDLELQAEVAAQLLNEALAIIQDAEDAVSQYGACRKRIEILEANLVTARRESEYWHNEHARVRSMIGRWRRGKVRPAK